MKCRACGQINAKHKVVCRQCGVSLKPERQAGSDKPVPPPLHSVSTKQEVPAWRKEVSEKARAYGERKRSLITPPGPLKPSAENRENSPPPAEMDPPETVKAAPELLAEPVVDVSALDLQQDSLAPEQPARLSHSVPRPVPRPLIRPAEQAIFELPPVVPSELPAENRQENLIARRSLSFLIDSAIIIVLFLLFRFVWATLAPLVSLPVRPDRLLSLLLSFAILHGLYYFYFYKTSRQTPGQVFFSLELRDRSLSRHIPAGRVFVRWLSMVLLNVLNLLPLLKHNQDLLLDRLSGTTLRLLKP